MSSHYILIRATGISASGDVKPERLARDEMSSQACLTAADVMRAETRAPAAPSAAEVTGPSWEVLTATCPHPCLLSFFLPHW